MGKQKIDIDLYMSGKVLEEQREQYHAMCRDELFGLQLNNFLWNMQIIKALNYPGILGWRGAFKKKPAIIVGAGPSLDKHGHLLKKYRDNFVIVAGDASLPVLVNKYDVYPHFVVMVDPTAKQQDNFKDIDTTKFFTIAPPIVHPSVFRKVDPKHMAVYNVKDPKNDLFEAAPYHIGKKGALPAGVLTSGSCFGFAAGCLQADPIIFIGHDLCYENWDKVYADGVVDMKHGFQKAAKFKGGCMLMPDINGNLVLTHQTLMMFWAWLRDNFKWIKTKIINSSECGILHFKGMKVAPFQETIDKYCSKEIVGMQEIIQKGYDQFFYKDNLVEELLLPEFKKEFKRNK